MLRRWLFLALLLSAATPFCVAAPPLYVIGSVPPQQIGEGGFLTFQLQSPKIGAADFSYVVTSGYPIPQGAITLNTVTGVFSYTPSPSDKFQFSLTFTSQVPGQTPDSQPVVIVPITTKSGKLSGFELPVQAGRVNGVAVLSALRSLDYQSRNIQYEDKANPATVTEANRRVRMIFP